MYIHKDSELMTEEISDELGKKKQKLNFILYFNFIKNLNLKIFFF